MDCHSIRGAAVTFLIDGYNLMHASGLARRDMPSGALQKARQRFLDWLADAIEGRNAAIRVVFDSSKATDRCTESDYRSVKVRFARGRTADDEIEELLAAEPRPLEVTVVSNDGRLREAARRRGAAFQSNEEFTDWVIEPERVAKPHATKSEKPEPSPRESENAAWLAAFSRPPTKRRRR
jgi:predicted RNA-binding protein with PIN domain